MHCSGFDGNVEKLQSVDYEHDYGYGWLNCQDINV